MDKSAQNIATADLRPGYRFDDPSGIWRLKVQAAVWPGLVVVLRVRAENALQVSPADHEDVVQAHRSAKAFALGARTGVFTTVRPSVRRTSSKEPENLASRSRSRMCLSLSLPVIGRFRACWVTQADLGRLIVPAREPAWWRAR